jgi:hypothetical protein
MQVYSILSELEEVERLAVPYSCSSSCRGKLEFDEFMSFLQSNGCNTAGSLAIEKFAQEAEYGVKAKTEFVKGSKVFEVPSAIILTLKNAVGLPIERLFDEDKMLASMPNVALAVFILYLKANCAAAKNGKPDRQDVVKWRPYLNILPNEFHTPLYFTLDELKMLQSSQCFCEFNFTFL